MELTEDEINEKYAKKMSTLPKKYPYSIRIRIYLYCLWL